MNFPTASSSDQNAPANYVYAGKYFVGRLKYSAKGGHVYEAYDMRRRVNVNMKFGHLLEPNSHEKEWRTLCALENESIVNPLLKEIVYDVVCGNLYQGIIFPQTAVNLERLLSMHKSEGTGRLPAEFSTRVFIQILEGCAFLNTNLESIHALIEPSSIDFCNISVIPNPEGGRLPATPRIVINELSSVQKIGIRDRDLKGYSLSYKAPEAALGLKLLKSSDVWAAGCVYYEMITGQPLFCVQTILELLNTIEKTIGPIPQRMLRMHLDFYGARNLRAKTDKNLGLRAVYDVSDVRTLESYSPYPLERIPFRLLRKALQTDALSRPDPVSMLALIEEERKRGKRLPQLPHPTGRFPVHN